MCLGIPMEVIAIDRLVARCSAKGVEREASLLLLQDDAVSVGDHVVVHLGYAIRKVNAEEARLAWELYDQILAAEAARPL
jgi:hydrogenase expression/formation protein HypC